MTLLLKPLAQQKNKVKSHNPEIHKSQTGQGKQWFSRLKAHVDVDGITGLMHNLNTTGDNLHDITERENLLHGESAFISVASCY